MKASANKTLVLSCEDIQKITLHIGVNQLMDNLIARLSKVIQDFDAEQTVIPIRSGFNYSQPRKGLIEWMPLYCKGEDITIKLVGYHPDNPAIYQLPTILSTISRYDSHTGHLVGLIDGVLPTALRTGAASAIASKALAKPQSNCLGLIGCGAQSITQLHALSRVFELTEVMIYDVDSTVMSSFERRCQSLQLNISIIPSTIEEIVNRADIVCTATSIEIGEGPLFEEVATKPWLHINAVGSDFPGKVEIPLSFLQKSFVCPDFKAQAIIEGECQQLTGQYIGASLDEVMKLPSKFKDKKEKLTVFDSTGWALEDQVVMDLFLEKALELGIGEFIAIETIPQDAKSPYEFVSTAATSHQKI